MNLGRRRPGFLSMHPPPPFTPWLRADGLACILDIAVQPGAKRSELVGLHDGALRIRVAAPALDGRGNAALCGWIAQRLDIPKRDVCILRGDKSRRKQVRVALPLPVVHAILDAALRDIPAS